MTGPALESASRHLSWHRFLCLCAGFVAAAGAELLGAGPVLTQIGAQPLSVVITIAILTAATIIPLQKVRGQTNKVQWDYRLAEGFSTSTVTHFR